MGYASLCLLSYNRAKFVDDCIRSIHETAGYPFELIVHDDGSSPVTQRLLAERLDQGLISTLIMNQPGHNEGVGRAINRCFSISTGDPIIKLDQDLLFEKGWLARVVEILNDDFRIGSLGLFKYHADPVEWSEMELSQSPHTRTPVHYVRDYVGSAIVVPASVYQSLGNFPEHSAAFAEDIEYKQRIQNEMGLELALPDTDLAHNRGFGIGPSTVVIAPGTVQQIKTGPVVFDG